MKYYLEKRMYPEEVTLEELIEKMAELDKVSKNNSDDFDELDFHTMDDCYVVQDLVAYKIESDAIYFRIESRELYV